MKQPKNSICVEDIGAAFDEWAVWVEDEIKGTGSEIGVAFASSESSALRLAIKRLDRLKRDCERELAKCERKER